MALTNTFVGFAAGCNASQNPAADNSTAIGANSYTTASNQLVLGSDSVEDVRACGASLFRAQLTYRNYFFANAGNATATGGASLGIGDQALNATTTGTNNVALGDFAMSKLTTATGSVAVGSAAMRESVTGIDCTAVGFEALRYQTTGVGDTGIGRRALASATEARNNTGVGDSAFWLNQGAGNVGVGYRVCEYNVDAADSVFVGAGAGVNRADGDENVFVGAQANQFPSATPNPDTGAGAVSAGSRNVGVGFQTYVELLGNDNVAVGNRSGYAVVNGSSNTFVGSGAGDSGTQKVDAVNSMALGAGTITTKDNQVVIGDSNVVETILRGVLRCTTYTVATLPSATTMGAGARAFVTDATASTFASTVAGGGSTQVPVYSDGTNWMIG